MNINVRKCNKCKLAIEIDYSNVVDIVFYKSNYYHKNCFCEFASKMSKSNSKYKKDWEYACEHIEQFEHDAAKELDFFKTRDNFNTYLLEHYDIISVPSNFWSVVSDISNGTYRRKKCNPVSIETLFECWKWGQQNLDKIANNNKMNHRGPNSDVERLKYDLAILVSKLPLYLKKKKKNESLESERKQIESEINNRINYDNISEIIQNTSDGMGDISDILDDFF